MLEVKKLEVHSTGERRLRGLNESKVSFFIVKWLKKGKARNVWSLAIICLALYYRLISVAISSCYLI